MLRDARTVLFSERNRFSLWLLQGLWQILGRDLERSVISDIVCQLVCQRDPWNVFWIVLKWPHGSLWGTASWHGHIPGSWSRVQVSLLQASGERATTRWCLAALPLNHHHIITSSHHHHLSRCRRTCLNYTSPNTHDMPKHIQTRLQFTNLEPCTY